MPSSYTASARYTLQATGENLSVWGVILNNGVFQLVDDNVNGIESFALSGAKMLTSVNGATDEARKAILNITGGTGGTITIPSVSKLYVVLNASAGDVILTTGGATNATVKAGEKCFVACDASAVKRVQGTDFGSARLTNVGYPSASTDAASKQYADDLAFTANAGILPAQTGNAGKLLGTNGSVASWRTIAASDLTDYATAILGLQVALAVAL